MNKLKIVMIFFVLVSIAPVIVSHAAYFTLLEGTPIVTTDAATSVVMSSARLNGTLDFDAEEDCYFSFEYGIISGLYTYNTEPWQGPVHETDTFYYDLSGLHSGTTYYYRARCYNVYATGYGSELSFTTTIGAPTIITNSASDISISTAKLRSYLASDGGETDPAGTSCGFEYDGAIDRYCAVDDASREIFDDNWVAQSVTASDDYAISAIGIKLYFEDGGSSPEYFTVDICPLDDPLPTGHPDTGDILSTSTYPTGNVTGSISGSWYLIDIPPFDISASDEFAIVIHASGGDTDNCIHWLTDESSAGYEDGSLETSTDGGSSWSTHSGCDTMFATFSGGVDYCVMESDSDVEIYDDNWSAQIFTTSQTYGKLIGVGLELFGEGIIPNDLIVDICSIDGGHPDTSGVITTGYLDMDSIHTATYGSWYWISVQSIVLSDATEYSIVLHMEDGDGSNNIHWAVSTSDPYGDGDRESSIDGGSSWSTETGEDCMFAIYETWDTSVGYSGGYVTGDYPYGIAFPLATGADPSAKLFRFRAMAYNTYNGSGNPVNGDILLFVTADYMDAPSDLKAVSTTGVTISLSWTKGEGSYKTKVMYKPGGYPSDYGDGTIAYFDTGSSIVLIDSDTTPVNEGVTYYFRTWAFAPLDYWSDGYDQDMVTTYSGVPLVTPFTVSDEPSSWKSSADPSKLSGTFFYPLIHNAETDIGMGSGTLFLILFIALSCGIGLFTYLISRSMALCVGATACCIAGMTIIGIAPLWIMFAYVAMAGSSWYLMSKVV